VLSQRKPALFQSNNNNRHPPPPHATHLNLSVQRLLCWHQLSCFGGWGGGGTGGVGIVSREARAARARANAFPAGCPPASSKQQQANNKAHISRISDSQS
jgi:hypothetical protein